MAETDSAPGLRVSLLGGFSITVAGEPVADRWRLRKAKALVKLLALAPGHRLHRDVVIDTFWPDAEPRAAANNLHQVLHYVRSVTGGSSIALHDDVVLLCPGGGLTVDVEQFEEATANALTSGDIAELRRALDLWTGPLLPEDQYAAWAIEHGARLADLHATLATAVGSRLLERGEFAAALAILEPLAASRPVDEQLHRALFEVLAGLGRRWEAISRYERLRAALDDAYSAEPEPETRATYRRLLAGGTPIPAAVRHNLPTSTTSFVGRSRLLSELSAYVERTRLLSLTGVGGVGKTRLALELARRLGVGTD
jgi:DNA-binding SARP family transcriptional activator